MKKKTRSIDALDEEWESPGEDFPIEENLVNWSRLKFAERR